ncbi:Xaa-Pro peptidase family protein [Rhizobium calliandrae]|uniref:Xaa-Pro peptidase family protein n=1 Tax=Rhizobium calliandrae TaxID=1312182 RepID=A0ABT7KJI4_9HYPH|nr:Xaa-Pro peptidase family protein [Rhizobium calliandrae]MDL2408596.1 Xaa-Pro peptidase family protein [Rhizobium calliandrae]
MHVESMDRSNQAAIDVNKLCHDRLARVRAEMEASEFDALLLFDQVNIRYATGARNMQIWAMRNTVRYCLIPRDGPIVLFEIGGRREPAEGLPSIGEVRPARPWFHYYAGEHADTYARDFADEIAATIAATHHSSVKALRVAVDRCDARGTSALRAAGLYLGDAQPLMEQARRIKTTEEVAAIRQAIAVAELGIGRMHEALRPGMTENALFSLLHQTNIEQGGEYIETRLLSSGHRTNPWYQEASGKVIAKGEIVSFDCDLIGPLGYGADLCGAFVCGVERASPAQRDLYRRAYDQIEHNTALLQPGSSFREILEKAQRLPATYHQFHRVAHGNGMSTGEFPAIGGRPGFQEGPIHDGEIEEGMVLCVGSYAGLHAGHEGLKLEHQLVIRENGPERLSKSLWDGVFMDP